MLLQCFAGVQQIDFILIQLDDLVNPMNFVKKKIELFTFKKNDQRPLHYCPFIIIIVIIVFIKLFVDM